MICEGSPYGCQAPHASADDRIGTLDNRFQVADGTDGRSLVAATRGGTGYTASGRIGNRATAL